MEKKERVKGHFVTSVKREVLSKMKNVVIPKWRAEELIKKGICTKDDFQELRETIDVSEADDYESFFVKSSSEEKK